MRKWVLLGFFAAAAFGGAVERAEAGCSTDLLNCYHRAAAVDSFWYRWAAGIDCELDFVECARTKLVGG
jgi:hypothetical protein